MPKIIIPRTKCSAIQRIVSDWTGRCFGFNQSYDESLQPIIDQWGLPWFRAGAVVLDEEGRILMVHEGRVQIKKLRDEELKQRYFAEGYSKNEWIDGDGGWNLPSGRLKLDESFEDAAIREVKEESGWDIEITGLLHIRHRDNPDNPYIMPVYLVKAISGPAQYHTTTTHETLEIGWYSPQSINRDFYMNGMLRSPEFVLDSLNALKVGVMVNMQQRIGLLVEITGGPNAEDMHEDRCENLMDCRSRWNVSLQLEGREEPYGIAAEIVTRAKAEAKIFSPKVINIVRRTNRQRGRKRWWKSIVDTVSQIDHEQITPKYAPDCIWRLGGRPNSWPLSTRDTAIFAEYHPCEQHGYAIIMANASDLPSLEAEFLHSIRTFPVTSDEEELFCKTW